MRRGWEILTEALESSKLDLIVCTPGKPVTPVQDALVESGHARWVNHEAIAAQYALGASGCGDRAVLIVKQVGMNAATDVLACAAPHRTGGAMVVIAGDDPGATSSQVEGDSRKLAAAIEVPCFEPAGCADIPDTLFRALEVSTLLKIPVVLRVTGPMMASVGSDDGVRIKRVPSPSDPFDPSYWSTDFVGHRRLMLEAMYALPEEGDFAVRPGNGALRIVASGQPAADVLADSSYELFVVRRVFPHPSRALAEFVASSASPILVLEESGVLVEDGVRGHTNGQIVLGRRSGHVPWAGPIDVEESLSAALRESPLLLAEPAPYPGDPHADLSPFGTLWTDAEELGLTPIATDAGHNGAAINLKGDPAPFSYGLGSSIGVAAGISLSKGRAAIAVIGDMGAFHNGLLGLVQAVRDQIPVIVFVDDDGGAETTGGQPTPSAPARSGECQESFADIARAVGVTHVETVTKESMTSEVLIVKLKELAGLAGPSVVVIDGK
jgi:indolepyruvate ferredoxin oxidoreductase alpha subunit